MSADAKRCVALRWGCRDHHWRGAGGLIGKKIGEKPR
jgi:hypothetical protein